MMNVESSVAAAAMQISGQDGRYPVMEHFYTLQGEGAFSGHAAYFIRLGGCDVGCVWCDVKESWDAAQHPTMTAAELVAAAGEHPGRMVVITGGEPTLHDLSALIKALHAAGFRVHIETSGTNAVHPEIDFVTLSPKKFKAPVAQALTRADELKVVVYHPSDLKWAETHAALVSPHCRLLLQPEWSRRERVTPLLLDYIKAHPAWSLSLQTHKFLNIP